MCAGVVLDVVAATETGDGDPGVAALADGGKEPLLTDGLGYLVVLHLVPEQALSLIHISEPTRPY